MEIILKYFDMAMHYAATYSTFLVAQKSKEDNVSLRGDTEDPPEPCPIPVAREGKWSPSVSLSMRLVRRYPSCLAYPPQNEGSQKKRKLPEDASEREDPYKRIKKSPDTENAHICFHCKTYKNCLTCPKCNITHYCSENCRLLNQTSHNQTCKHLSSANSILQKRTRDFKTNAQQAGYDTSPLDDLLRKLMSLPLVFSILLNPDVVIFLCDLCIGSTRILEALSKRRDGSPKYEDWYHNWDDIVPLAQNDLSILLRATHLAINNSLTISPPSPQINKKIQQAKERISLKSGVVWEMYPKITPVDLGNFLEAQSFFLFPNYLPLSGLSSADGRRVYMRSNTSIRTIEHNLVDNVAKYLDDMDPTHLFSLKNALYIHGHLVGAGDYYEYRAYQRHLPLLYPYQLSLYRI
eukprot:TRINITY_DN10233_c0_g1_i1.p1 TRINITY_DN10233_c0_g1~~TRINITY_DN10233_c0_g1_i1.p1  ORF type:complete len:407 (+),score=90.06 TRINITY_DN10233_c0_g1_i1:25-1245(+)